MFNSYTLRRQGDAGCFTQRTILLLLALLMQTAYLHAQSKDRSHYQLLWRIDAPGAQPPSYLFGTMHVTDKRVFDFSDSVLTALQSSTAFAMEVDMDSMMAYMLSPDGPFTDTVDHLKGVLAPDEYRYVDSLILKKTGAPLEQLKLKRWWFLEKLLIDDEEELSKSAGNTGAPESVFLDAWLHQKATSLNKPVHSLERMQNQLDFMSDDVSEMQKQSFLWNIGYYRNEEGDTDDPLKARVAYLDSLANLYYMGDLQQMTRLVNNGDGSDDPGLTARNSEMTGNLAALIKKGSVFAAVGAAHLPGAKGIISLLREKGYTVTPVKATFTGVAQQERQQLDSIKGYSLNRIADGYSVALPGNPIAYPIPNMNRKMYVGINGNDAGFAIAIDIPLLAADKSAMVKSMVANMAAQGNAEVQRSYPITYRNMPGTEAVMLQGNMPFYLRLFLRNNRAFIFMYLSEAAADSSARNDFFQSVRFYDIVRPVTVYDTISRPQFGFSVIMPSDAMHAKIGEDELRPEELYSALDDANSISYVMRVEKMKKGYYSKDDRILLENIRAALIGKDSTVQLLDSTVTELDGLPRHNFTYRHANGFISRIQYIPRGNLAYCQLCVYDAARTDSSYWHRFLDDFHILPFKAKAPDVSFVPADSSFAVTGPEPFTGGAMKEYNRSSAVKLYQYHAMDSASYAMYIVEMIKYSGYFHYNQDTLINALLNRKDTNFILMGDKQYTSDGLPVHETEVKGRYAGMRRYRKVIVAGHTVYQLSAIVPEEIAATGYAQQFFASFRPGAGEHADTRRLDQKKLDLLLKDLQSADTAIFYQASEYLENFAPDSSDLGPVLSALNKPFPADTGDSNAKVRLLLSLENIAGDTVVHAAETLFADLKDVPQRKKILHFLSSIASDSSIRALVRLAPELPEGSAQGWDIFTYALKKDSLYQQYLPAMIAAAEQSESFLHAFSEYTSFDSLWFAPQFSQYKLERLLPGLIKQFDRQFKKWKSTSPDEDSSWRWRSDLLSTGEILALPGMPVSLTESFRELLADSTIELRALGARGLMSRGIRVSDKVLNSILADYSIAHLFVITVKQNKQLSYIRHLLTQELLGRIYLAHYLSDDYEVTAIEQVTRVKVKQVGKKPDASMILYRYKTDENEDWEYVLNGSHPQNTSELAFTPLQMHWISDKSIVNDKVKLAAEAQKAYSEIVEGPED